MARKKSGIGLLGWFAVLVLLLLLFTYLEHRGLIHLPASH
jgi:hypothetical protein